MSKLRKGISLGLLGLASVGIMSIGAEAEQGMGAQINMPTYADFDLNGDGALLREEFYEARGQLMRKRAEQGYPMRNAANAPPFERVDVNRDGKITQQEFSDYQAVHRQMRREQ